MNEVYFEVDARGLMCPLPLLRLKKALQEIEAGDLIKVMATDPAAHLDFGVFLEQAGHQQLSFATEGDILVFVIQKGGRSDRAPAFQTSQRLT